ncbi:hypothetical protein U5903_04345 [Cereibacter johrii]|uniref:hypothetical protein n=1 Tax=Cereibacter johrii TaxID=445629 RepID=UPI002B25E3C0|nr:hypothetical protein [Cereibacter johrii]MEA5159999.1 hypothetical protein [Cereibacter johrii]
MAKRVKKESAPVASLTEGRAAAAAATNREDLEAAIDMIAATIRRQWYELRTEEKVLRTARWIAGEARGVPMHEVEYALRRGKDMFRLPATHPKGAGYRGESC